MAKKILTEEEAKIKLQGRRRLLGAISLTVIVVILLPMFLDKEPPAPTQSIEVQIPDKDKAGEFVPKMVLPPTNAASGVATTAEPTVIAPLMDRKPVVAVPAQPVEVKPVITAQPVVEPIAQAVVESKPAEIKPKGELKQQAAPKPAEKPAAKRHSGFVVQVGAFASAEGAHKLKEKLRKQGYPSYTEKAGNKIRVRIGDYATRAEADKIRRKLEIQGMQPDVISLK